MTCCAANVVVRVKAPPLDLDADLIERVLDRHWGIGTAELRYLPVGFGDHHWHVNAARDNYFVTVRDLRLDGRAQDADGVIAAGLVARLHVASRERPAAAVVEDFRIPHRSALEASLTDLERPWHTGPFGEQARAEVVAHQAAIQSALEQYDTLVAAAGTSSRDWCLTHGEPSGANLVQDQTGAHYLVDWESARVAPPERDLVDLGSSDWALDHYRQLAESPPARTDLLRLYRLWYALAETSVYLLQFRASHTADDNMVESWQNFLTFLPGRQGSVF